MLAYLDANIFVNLASGGSPFLAKCQTLFRAIERKEIEAAASILAVAEAYEVLARSLSRAKAAEWLAIFLSYPIKFMPVDLSVFISAVAQGQEHRLRTFDAIHLASALMAGADVIYSFDKDFDNLEIKRAEP